MSHRIHPKKLLHSKWTSCHPQRKEKHFMVTEVEFDEDQNVIHCVLQAVINKRDEVIDWQRLRDDTQWQMGWK